jgi:hypothetical protein
MICRSLLLACSCLLSLATRVDAAVCAPSDTALCIQAARFQVRVHWTDFHGNSGSGRAVAITPDTGYFWFFASSNVELVVKVIDGRAVNRMFWVFCGALSTVSYELTVQDTQTGTVKTYTNPAGRLRSFADTSAFGPFSPTPKAPPPYVAPELTSATALTTPPTAALPQLNGCRASSSSLCLVC